MAESLFDLLKKAFSKPKEKLRYLVQVNEKCPYLKEENIEWHIVESNYKLKKGMLRSYDCRGYCMNMSEQETEVCNKCGYKRTIMITDVFDYSFKKSKQLRAKGKIYTIEELL